MKKLLIAVALTALAPTAALAMDCCKDCACCKDKMDAHGDHQPEPAPAPQPK